MGNDNENMGKWKNGKSALVERIPLLRQKAITPPIEKQQQAESTDMILNRLISGSGVKRRR